ncbi:hypothetical protein BAZ12_18640 [Elizabethkingia miricola]|uniref:DUF4328 domain-containing protein n=1 Tax=Elizabethkingia miricola TaxID=172045 RepID=A0ABD4DKA9_ELIMR|nr:hypothetical protein [Elizabethkingia miricola]KUY17160.1 hypothetical protein ATB95_12330 [Elizabethkingia miricola]OPC72293.1 hypothetical protein BAZ13_06210 [Elizabethkingia miricola]OPC76034.1 hypothetical protein BAZ12_18640 [Elizabethkingia miricola]SPW31950.1 Uncharacterised protein [Elizabethkingia miricola]
MINNTVKIFNNLENLLYISLILIGGILTADIISTEILKQSLTDYFNNFKISDIVLFSISYIMFIFSAVILFCIIEFLFNTLLRKFFNTNNENNTNYYTLNELLNDAISNDNSVMYNHYKELKKNMDLKTYWKYSYSLVIFLSIYNLTLKEGLLRTALHNSENNFPKIMILTITTNLFFGVFYIFQKENNFTYIEKKENSKPEKQ